MCLGCSLGFRFVLLFQPADEPLLEGFARRPSVHISGLMWPLVVESVQVSIRVALHLINGFAPILAAHDAEVLVEDCGDAIRGLRTLATGSPSRQAPRGPGFSTLGVVTSPSGDNHGPGTTNTQIRLTPNLIVPLNG
ncbi:MAG TPA: hypothetical protein DIT46_03005 [Gemmatimonadetes bacterium]|nr:hypothetical protein [Gemmatimonadota bacterium]